MLYHSIAFFLGFLLDLILGDPYWLPHPIRLIGNLIVALEKRFLSKETKGKEHKEQEKSERRRGTLLVFIVLSVTFAVTAFLVIGTYLLHPYLGVAVETIMTYQILAVKCLKVESMKVYQSLTKEGIEEARKAVAMIVGRDTAVLDGTGVAKAAIETVAENTSDGVIAPMLYTALGGPVLGFLYKAVNTMDSMVGYKNEKYLNFGRCAAKLDDAANYVPARISGWLMVAASFLAGFDGKNAKKIYLRDRRNHASPNSAQTEAVMAGALGVQLAGNAYYFGKLYEKPTIGDSVRPIEREDIPRSNRLLYVTAGLGLLIFALARFAVLGLILA